MADVRQQAALLALLERVSQRWHLVAALVERAGSALALIRDGAQAVDADEAEFAAKLAAGVCEADVDRYTTAITGWTKGDIRLVTVLDEDYPLNLQEVFDRPPFLFLRGDLSRRDSRAVAVVGTRQASEEGRAQARTLASGLAKQGVTVMSGIARASTPPRTRQPSRRAGERSRCSGRASADRFTRRRTEGWRSASSTKGRWSRSSGPTPLRRRRRSHFATSP
jgi:DNA processing protein